MPGCAQQAGLRAGLQYSVTVEKPQPKLGPKKGRSRALQPPQMYQLEDTDLGFDSIEVMLSSLSSLTMQTELTWWFTAAWHDNAMLWRNCIKRPTNSACHVLLLDPLYQIADQAGCRAGRNKQAWWVQEAQNAASMRALYELARDRADLPDCLPDTYQHMWRAWEGDKCTPAAC